MSGTIKRTFAGILRTETLLEISSGMSNDPPQEAQPFRSFMFDQSGTTACYNEAGAKTAAALLLLVSQQRSQTVFHNERRVKVPYKFAKLTTGAHPKIKAWPSRLGIGPEAATPICKN